MSGDVDAHRPRPLSGGLWSLLSWLRRDDPSLSIESLSSIGSDRTTASFAFLTPEHYRIGKKPTVLPPPGPPTDSYKRRVHDRNLRFKHDYNLTLHRKYGLHKSQESLGYDTFSLPPYKKSDNLSNAGRDRRAASEGLHRRAVHVPGKRRAPPPPIRASSLGPSTSLTRKSRKRPAPLPPPIAFTTIDKIKTDKKVNSEPSMNTNSENDVKLLKANINLMELKSQKHSKTESNVKETRPRSEKNFLKHIFESKKRHSVETASIRLLPSISELDKQAAEIIKNDKLKGSQNCSDETSLQTSGDDMWICTICFRKYKASTPICINCPAPKNTINTHSTVLEGSKKVIPNASNIYTQTDYDIKPSCSKNNKSDERQKLKEMLKEMKDSLPKKMKYNHDNQLPNNVSVEKLNGTDLSTTTPTLRIGTSNEKLATSTKPETIQETKKEIQSIVIPTIRTIHQSELPCTSQKLLGDDLKQTNNVKNTENLATPVFKEIIPKNVVTHQFDLNTPLKISSLLNPVNVTKSENIAVTSKELQNDKVTKSTQSEGLLKTPNNAAKEDVKSALEQRSESIKVEGTRNHFKISKETLIEPKVFRNDMKNIEKGLHDSNKKNIQKTINENDKETPVPSTSAVASTSSNFSNNIKHVENINHHLKRRELINQLEKSIANGDEQAAADAAAKLAQLRLSCSVLSFSSQIFSESRNLNPNCTEVVTIPVVNDANGQDKKDNLPSPFELKSTVANIKQLIKEKQSEPVVETTAQNTQNVGKGIEKPLCTTANPNESKVIIKVWVEDREATRGPINLNIGKRNVLADLRREAEKSLDIPTNLQRWIIGRTLCSDNNTPLYTLAGPELKAPFYLCLVKSETKTSTELKNDKTETSTTKKEVHESVNVYNELVQLEQQALIANTETFECGVCLEECAPGNGVILRECVHSFCRECLTDIVRHSEEPDVSCPAVACRSLLQEREIRTLVSSEDYEKWLARGLAAAENGTRNSFHCRTRDCTGWALCEPGVRHFPCPVCKKINCVPCQSIHEGETCEQHRVKLESISNANPDHTDDSTRALLLNLIKKGEALECPECKAIITKKWGCDWVKCSACKTEICWVTRGRRWGQAGRGDTSGGCRCGVDGKRCHPSCGYCH